MILGLSFHCELLSCSTIDFVGDYNFLCPSPEIFMTPSVSPFHEVKHWQHWNCKSSWESLSSNDWEEKVNSRRWNEAILEPSVLISINLLLTVHEVIFWNSRHITFIDKVADKITFLFVWWCQFSHWLLIECFRWF